MVDKSIITAHQNAEREAPLNFKKLKALTERQYEQLNYQEYGQLLTYCLLLLDADNGGMCLVSLHDTKTSCEDNEVSATNAALLQHTTAGFLNSDLLSTSVLNLKSWKAPSENSTTENSPSLQEHQSSSDSDKMSDDGIVEGQQSPKSSSSGSSSLPIMVNIGEVVVFLDVHHTIKLSAKYEDLLLSTPTPELDLSQNQTSSSNTDGKDETLDMRLLIENARNFLIYHCKKISSIVENYYYYLTLNKSNQYKASLALLGLKENDNMMSI